MRRITKIAIIVGFLAGIYLLLPFAAGIVAQRYAQNFLNNENKTLGNVLGIQLNFTQYHRGWFRSTANLQIEKKAADGSFEVVKIIPVVIKHGPSYHMNGRVRTGFAMISSSNMPINQDSFYQIAFHENIGFSGEHGTVVFFTSQINNASNATPHDFQANSLTLNVRSNLKANQFLFVINGHGLHFQDPKQSISLNIQDLNASLKANYLDERHWDLTLGVGFGKNQLSAVLPDTSATPVTLNADQINLQGVHVDTQKMATLLGEAVVLKQATDAQQPVKPTAWMALFQQFLTQIIHSDTSADIQGLSITTPMGQIQGHYDVSFPTLLDTHDYFDIVTRNVSGLQLSVPSWSYVDTASNMTFVLKNMMFNQTSNTIFSRSSAMQVGEFDIMNTAATTTAPLMAAMGISYSGELHGDFQHLSQIMQWDLNKVCFTDDCFNQVHGNLKLLKMNYDAFRGIASATQQIVQYDPKQAESINEKWMGVVDAYAKLITPKTQVILSHDMMTSAGEVKVHGELSWPGLNPNATTVPTMQDFLNQSVYQLNVLFPAVYVNTFLNSQTALLVNSAKQSASTIKTEPSFEAQTIQFLQYAIAQGYLKKVGDAYVLDLSGKGSVITINNVPWKTPR